MFTLLEKNSIDQYQNLHQKDTTGHQQDQHMLCFGAGFGASVLIC